MDTVPQMLILMAGMPGSGKSTVAQALGRDLEFPVIDKDVILSALLECDIPETMAQPAAYRVMFDLGDNLLQQGILIVLDSPAGLPENISAAERISRSASAQLITVLCLADQAARNKRFASRNSLPSQPVGISKTPGNAREHSMHLQGDTIEVDIMRPLDIVVHDALASVRARIAELA